jgi:hypothetical protein
VINPGEQPEEQAADVISDEVKEAATGGKEQFLLARWTSINSSWLENDHDVDANVTTTEVDVAASEGMKHSIPHVSFSSNFHFSRISRPHRPHRGWNRRIQG